MPGSKGEFNRAYSLVQRIISSLNKILSGVDENIKLTIASIIAGGHVLIEGPPGTGKTLLAHSLAKIISGEFRRVQGNPDLLPTDLTGYHRYTLNGDMVFVKGPIFTNILLFDELNRTPPRSQSALLQAMAEYSVSVDGITYRINKPFHVIATEIPISSETGVYPLTLTLRDRFWIKIYSEYVEPLNEYRIVKRADQLYDYAKIEVDERIELSEFKWLQSFMDEGVYVDDRIVQYIVNIMQRIRSDDRVLLGPSHRGSIYLYRIAKAYALINKRDYVIPDDIKYLLPYVIAHRIILAKETGDDRDKIEILMKLVDEVPVPKE